MQPLPAAALGICGLLSIGATTPPCRAQLYLGTQRFPEGIEVSYQGCEVIIGLTRYKLPSPTPSPPDSSTRIASYFELIPTYINQGLSRREALERVVEAIEARAELGIAEIDIVSLDCLRIHYADGYEPWLALPMSVYTGEAPDLSCESAARSLVEVIRRGLEDGGIVVLRSKPELGLLIKASAAEHVSGIAADLADLDGLRPEAIPVAWKGRVLSRVLAKAVCREVE